MAADGRDALRGMRRINLDVAGTRVFIEALHTKFGIADAGAALGVGIRQQQCKLLAHEGLEVTESRPGPAEVGGGTKKAAAHLELRPTSKKE
ncbi:hypothetical protein ACVWXO_004102 [Bradyrhizobium sp. LM2.7]